MIKLQRENNNLDGEKPAYFKMQEYADLMIKQLELQYEVNLMQLKDQISQSKSAIEGLGKEIVRLERNHKPKEEEVIEDKEAE